MNFNKRPLIGIAGVKNSGKDTVASMISFSMNVVLILLLRNGMIILNNIIEVLFILLML